MQTPPQIFPPPNHARSAWFFYGRIMPEQKLIAWAGFALACLRIVEVALDLVRQALVWPSP
jgi:hypothetical protein